MRFLVVLLSAAALTAAYHRTKTETVMVDTAQRFLASLSPEQRAKAVIDFSDKDRMNFHYVPDSSFQSTYGYPRRGLVYREMDAPQRRLADALLSAGLSQTGFVKVVTIMSLEDILRVLESDTARRRDVEKYYFSVFGEPSQTGTWGWRVEGHHISLHFTLKGGTLVSSSPTFLGANPHEVRQGPRNGVRPLGKEEDLARELVRSLDAGQQKAALVADEAYSDILTRADTRAKLDNQAPGLPASKLNSRQFEALTALLQEYAQNLPPDIAEARLKAVQSAARDKIFFAWAGSIEPGKGDYYRIQAPSFLVEYDNTQNNNNHSHTVWRDFEGDFGRDVLAWHHRLYDHGLTRAAD
jgi:hypothetical protein